MVYALNHDDIVEVKWRFFGQKLEFVNKLDKLAKIG